MDVTKYAPGYYAPKVNAYRWVKKDHIEKAPIWCSVDLRDGNQALIVPMSLEEKLEFFQMLVKIGFREIEVGFPAASETEYEFLRTLIEKNMIPDDVTVQVLTQCREHIIRKTFEAVRGAKKAVIHFYNSTSSAQREQVFHKSKEEVHELKKDYPEVEYSTMFVDVDNAAMQIVKDPSQFDVIVTENLFGDILSDEASEITGSIGMIPSSSLGDTSNGLYEPIHGSAPDIAGKDIVNPIACIISVGMMLRYSFGMKEEADDIENAVNTVLNKGYRTADIMQEGKTLVGTRAMGEAILKEI